jgi:hypothetical protein
VFRGLLLWDCPLCISPFVSNCCRGELSIIYILLHAACKRNWIKSWFYGQSPTANGEIAPRHCYMQWCNSTCMLNYMYSVIAFSLLQPSFVKTVIWPSFTKTHNGKCHKFDFQPNPNHFRRPSGSSSFISHVLLSNINVYKSLSVSISDFVVELQPRVCISLTSSIIHNLLWCGEVNNTRSSCRCLAI